LHHAHHRASSRSCDCSSDQNVEDDVADAHVF
jgi:hypothetical protein